MRLEQRTVDETDAGLRIDAFVSQACGVTRSAAQRMLEQGDVTHNGAPCVKSLRVAAGDTVCVQFAPARPVAIAPQDIPLTIVYEDDSLLVVNKPKGMVVHPAAGNPDGTLVNALLYHCAGGLSGINGELRPGIVHRIDKDTSGLLVVAKDDDAHTALAQQFAEHSIERVYHAVVYGNLPQDSGFVESPLGRHPVERKRMAVMASGKYAYTAYEVLARYRGFTHVALRLRTGRTHQIRVHMASIGHPVAGDAVYGPKKCITALGGQCLHAKTLGFVHPRTGETVCFDSALPEYFTRFLRQLEE